eukprot:11228311-Lingulodinium_polyedra.AAC.2
MPERWQHVPGRFWRWGASECLSRESCPVPGAHRGELDQHQGPRPGLRPDAVGAGQAIRGPQPGRGQGDMAGRARQEGVAPDHQERPCVLGRAGGHRGVAREGAEMEED